MDRPRPIDSGEARQWNEEVNRRRIAHHEQRCAEDPLYRKAYEYLQEQNRRVHEQHIKPLAEAMAAEAQQRMEMAKTKDGREIAVPICCPTHQMPENMKSQPVNDCMKDADRPQRIKTHEEVLRERAAMETCQRMSESERIAAGGNALAMGILALMFADPEAMKRRTEEMKAMQPYLDEIHETDKRYRNEEIHLSGFEW